MISKDHPLPIIGQCRLLGLARSSLYYRAVPIPQAKVELMMVIDKLHTDWPFFGSRKISRDLRCWGFDIGREQTARLMREMGIKALFRKPRLSIPRPGFQIYPYLLKDLPIVRPNQVWAADITYIPMAKGFAFLVAIIDVMSRKVLSWELSNTLDVDFCLVALERALQEFGPPEIFNTDQGCQFTSEAFTDRLKAHGIKISMDGKGRWIDNVFIERLWRSVKYEEVYLKAYDSMKEAREGLAGYFDFYNRFRLHQTLNYKTPEEIYNGHPQEKLAA